MDISSASELKEAISQALASCKEVKLDVSSTAELDVTALQLLWAAAREARELEIGFTLAGQIPPEISATVSAAGFERFPVSEEVKWRCGVRLLPNEPTLDKYKQAFQEEAREILVELEATLLELNEDRSDKELVGKTFRALHTIIKELHLV